MVWLDLSKAVNVTLKSPAITPNPLQFSLKSNTISDMNVGSSALGASTFKKVMGVPQMQPETRTNRPFGSVIIFSRLNGIALLIKIAVPLLLLLYDEK